MLSNVKIPEKKYKPILIFTSLLILSISLEALFKVKDTMIFEEWMDFNNISINSDYSIEQVFSSYLILNIINMLMKIVIPVSFSIHSYFAYTRIGINQLYIVVWSIFLIIGLVYEIIGFNYGSIFFYINIIGYIILIITVFSLNSIISNPNQRGD